MAIPAAFSNPSLTPADVEQRRRLANALGQMGSDASPVGHWTQAIARVLQGGVSGYYDGTASKGEKEGIASRGAFMQEAMKNPQAAAASGAGNAWTTDIAQNIGQKVIAQNMQRSDPAYQMGLKLKQAEIDMLPLKRQQMEGQIAGQGLQQQMTQAQLQQMKLATPEKRAEMAAQYGLQPGTPGYQSFVLMGQMPQAQSTDLLAQAKQREAVAAQLGMAPGSPAYQSFVATGKMPREDQQPLSATDKKAILEADELVLASQNAVRGLDTALRLSKDAYSGVGAGARSAIVSNMPWATPNADATRELDNVVTTQALESLKATFGAAPTEGERKILLDIQGASSQPQAVREAIYRRAREAALRRLQFNQQRAQELRGGTYYGGQQGGGSWKAPGGQTAPQQQPQPADPLGIR